MTSTPTFLYDLIGQLRRRGLQIGVDDCLDLHRALSAGFGLASDDALRRLCLSLWAKSAADAEIVDAAFTRVGVPEWTTSPSVEAATGAGEAFGARADTEAGDAAEPGPVDPAPAVAEPPALHGLPGLVNPPPRTGRRDTSLVLSPQYPVTMREVIQAWRVLRRPTRQGPPIELDVRATLDRRASTGVRTPPVLVAARRNTARLLLLVDRQGSMAPFHDYVDHVRSAMERAGRFDAFTVLYFHNTAGRSPGRTLLDRLTDPFSPALDEILDRIEPLPGGTVYADPDLTEPRALETALAGLDRATSTVVVSDAGAARGGLNTSRLLDTLALARAVRAATGGLVWLNPVTRSRWPRSTAEQVARHIAMFPLTRTGMYRAVDVLRGRPTFVERPL